MAPGPPAAPGRWAPARTAAGPGARGATQRPWPRAIAPGARYARGLSATAPADAALRRLWGRLTRQSVIDRSLSALTLLLLTEVVRVPPLVKLGVFNRHFADLVFVAGLAMGVWMLADHTLAGRSFNLTATASVVLRVANLWLPDTALRTPDAVFAGINLLTLCWLTLASTLAGGPINVHRVLGAISAYLLLGLACAHAHRLVAIQAEGAYLLVGRPARYDELVPKLAYYSFVSLTTLGFGDITPPHPAARAVTTLEALIGVLYPTALLGWLVSNVTRGAPPRA